ncbi:OLC1v1004572C1 [Oldenlandia corymbosa var. corymbosa]|uniref:OLC1v1004572C1 n=1 Tax=Oldenlandia corymbosa var. corymbosa TaxID=529605 RepID=A0AAV1DCL5_OLDCO|nr:OLC1v1004572C1 [Oldenlandia corymbosa var. corymbosa]
MVAATIIDDSIGQENANDKEEMQTYINNGNDDDHDDSHKNQQSEAVSNNDDYGDESNENQQSHAEGKLEKIQRGWGNALEKIEQDKGLTAKEKQSHCWKIFGKIAKKSSELEMKKEDDYQCPKEQNTDELSTTHSISTTEEGFQKDGQKTEELNSELVVILKEQIRELEMKLCAVNTSSKIYRSILHDCVFLVAWGTQCHQFISLDHPSTPNSLHFNMRMFGNFPVSLTNCPNQELLLYMSYLSLDYAADHQRIDMLHLLHVANLPPRVQPLRLLTPNY